MSDNKTSFRDKARLNIHIARDLEESFGGSKADYLIKLNRKLKQKILAGSSITIHITKKGSCGMGILVPGRS